MSFISSKLLNYFIFILPKLLTSSYPEASNSKYIKIFVIKI